jgi:hypothetical protein
MDSELLIKLPVLKGTRTSIPFSVEPATDHNSESSASNPRTPIKSYHVYSERVIADPLQTMFHIPTSFSSIM